MKIEPLGIRLTLDKEEQLLLKKVVDIAITDNLIIKVFEPEEVKKLSWLREKL